MAELLALADDETLQMWNSLRLSYTETQGLPLLRQAVAERLFTGIAPDQLVVAAPQELVFLCMQASAQNAPVLAEVAQGSSWREVHTMGSVRRCTVLLGSPPAPTEHRASHVARAIQCCTRSRQAAQASPSAACCIEATRFVCAGLAPRPPRRRPTPGSPPRRAPRLHHPHHVTALRRPALQALLSPGDHVVCTFPGYQSLYECAQSIGCEVSRWHFARCGCQLAVGAAHPCSLGT